MSCERENFDIGMTDNCKPRQAELQRLAGVAVPEIQIPCSVLKKHLHRLSSSGIKLAFTVV